MPVAVVVFGLAAYGLSPLRGLWPGAWAACWRSECCSPCTCATAPYGYYFHFKLLAFIGPLVLVMAAVGAARLRRWGPALLALLVVATAGSVVAELDATGSQLPQATIQLSALGRLAAAERLDPPRHVAAATAVGGVLPRLATRCARSCRCSTPTIRTWRRRARPTTSSPPLDRRPPADAIGPSLRRNQGYRLYRENPAVPGPANCTQRRFDRIYTGVGFNPR